MNPYRYTKWYRSRRGLVFGVCQGLADWKQMSAGMLRLMLILISLVTGIIPVAIAYTAFAIFLPPEPQEDPGEDPEWKKRFFNE